MVKLLIGRQYPIDLIKEIENSKSSIKILMYDWRWYSHQPTCKMQILNQAIFKKAKEGHDIKVILNNNSIKKILEDQKIKVHVSPTSRTMHIKLVIIDEKILYLGSHNFSINAFEINHEMTLKIDDKEIIERCNNFYKTLCLL